MPATVQPGPASDEFALLADQFRPELLVHCYRMLGSVQDAEDQVQETLLRAWRSYGSFEGRSSLRTWLYRIATNACLRAMENRERRPLPSGLGAPGDDPAGPVAPPASEVSWLEPFPDALLRPESADPATVAAARSGLRLALIAALQQLPARQRTVLILRDVLGWRAAEAAALLGVSVTAVNSALQRARGQLRQAVPAADNIREPASQAGRAVLDRYAAAIENADVAALVQLLHEDATFEMPPMPMWFRGRDNIGRFLGTRVLTSPGVFTTVPAAANGQPALAIYRRAEDGTRRAYGVQVLTLRDSRVAGVVAFLDPGLFPAFGLPPKLPAAGRGGRCRPHLLTLSATPTACWTPSPCHCCPANPMPCLDLRMLLAHAEESLAILHEASPPTSRRERRPRPAHPASDGSSAAALVSVFRQCATALLHASAQADVDLPVTIEGHPMPLDCLRTAGALEIAVHAWDISQSCGQCLPIPDEPPTTC